MASLQNKETAGDDTVNTSEGAPSRTTSGSLGQSMSPTGKDVEGIEYDTWTLRRRPWKRGVTPFERIVKHEYEGSGTEQDPYQVTWIDNDKENPLELPDLQKWTLCFYVSFSTLCVSLASSAYSGAIKSIHAELGGSQIVITLGISLYVLGFALGPLIWAPLSEVAGRRRCFLFSFAFFTLWNAVACASPNLGSLIVFRFLAGAFGSSPLTNAGGSLADVFRAKERGLAMTIFAACPFMGPALGPITGGFLGESAGWKWVMGMLAIYAGSVTVMGIFLQPETYAPVLLRQRAVRLSRATGKRYISKADVGKNVNFGHMLKVALGRPWLLLVFEPIVLLLSLYQAVVYAILYSFFSAFPIIFQQVRGWSVGIGGLAFLGILVGMMSAIIMQTIWVNPAYAKEVDKHGGILAPPEARMPQAILGAIVLVVGLAGFSATTFPSIHWIVPIIFSAPAGFGMVCIFIALQSYLIDAYLLYAASVLAASSVVRSVLGAIFPILAPYMYHPGGNAGHCPTASCGIHVGPGIAALLALIFVPAPWYFHRYGPMIRKRCRYSAEADKLLQSMMRPADQAPPLQSLQLTSKADDMEGQQQVSVQQSEKRPEYVPQREEQHVDEYDEHLRDSDTDSVRERMHQLTEQLSRQGSVRSEAEESLRRVPSFV